MKIRTFIPLGIILFINSCISIPQETVKLSQTLGKDLEVLQSSHRSLIIIHYKRIKEDINKFIEDTYAPFVIHYVLNKEWTAYKKGDSTSLYGIIKFAGLTDSKDATSAALEVMTDFQKAARKQIEKKQKELLKPIEDQEHELLKALDQSYRSAIYANSTISGHLQSIRKVKEAQSEALSMVGIANAEQKTIDSLVKLSENVSSALQKAEQIDVKSDEASKKIQEISEQIKKVTTKTN